MTWAARDHVSGISLTNVIKTLTGLLLRKLHIMWNQSVLQNLMRTAFPRDTLHGQPSALRSGTP